MTDQLPYQTKMNQVKLNFKKKPQTYVFIDGSYFIFRRYCATKVWYTHHTSTGEEEDCSIENQDFVEKYTKHFNDWLTKINKQFKPDKVFWFKDDSKGNVWRTPIFDQYKAHRDDLCPPHVGEFFKYAYDQLISEKDLIFVDQCESDDAIAISARYENEHTSNNIIIFTGDTDYLQLVNNKTRVVNFKGQKLADLPMEVVIGTSNKKKIKETVDADTYLLIKILLGDKTDGISGVPGCGPVTAYKLATNPDLLREYISSDQNRQEIYQHNLLMISFESIPEQLKKNITQEYLRIKETN